LHALRARAIEAGFDFKNGDMIQPPQVNRPMSNQASAVNSEDLTLKFLKYLPIYRPGISPLARGLEIGMAHGYWLVGPFATLASLRNSDVGNLVGLIATGSLVVIVTIGFSIYGTTSFERQVATVPSVPQAINSTEGWSQFTEGFLIGGIGGAIFAYLLLNSLAVFAAIA
jgi:photosystem II CP43 chlorophyll apoprotein